MKVLVCGSRSFDDWALLSSELESIYINNNPPELTFDNKIDFTIIEGGAIGADFLARVWAKFKFLPFEEYKADWKTYGKSAGAVRNQKMLDSERPDLVIAFWDGNSSGTYDMISRAELLEYTVKVVRFESSN